jgi:hypothetical protein
MAHFQKLPSEHWKRVDRLFDRFSDEDIANILKKELPERSRAFQERLLMATTLLQSESGNTYKKQTRTVYPTTASRFLLVSRDQFALQSTGHVVAHQFRISTTDSPEHFQIVSIAGPQPSCGCTEFLQRPGFCCQHILFVYLHALKHPCGATIYNQMGNSNYRMVPPLPKESERLCIICFFSLEQASTECNACNMHATCLDFWKRGIAKHYGKPFSCPCNIDLSSRRIINAEAGVLVSSPSRIS